MNEQPKLPELACCANCAKWQKGFASRECYISFTMYVGTEPRYVCGNWVEAKNWRIIVSYEEIEEATP